MTQPTSTTQPHRGQPVYTTGAAFADAAAAMVMIHGRGASAQSILSLSAELRHPSFAYLAPQAAGGAWYPFRFLEPLERNEPYLSSALRTIDTLIDHLGENGFPPERLMLLGFSQGACLALEYAARHTRRYGGVVALSGGLIGPDGTPRDYPGSLAETPIFLGCSDVNAHIPLERVNESAEVMERLGGAVTKRIYPGMDHTVNDDEIAFVRELMSALAAGSPA